MDAINRIDNGIFNQPDQNHSAPQDAVTTLENFIDHMVTAENNLTKAAEQTAIKNEAIQAEFDKRIAFLSVRLHQAQSALAALEGAQARHESTPTGSELINTKKSEVVYWRTLLHQVCSPDQLNSGV